MRLLALDLIAYGKFTDYRIEFPAGKGVTLLYGANEAGKSTCLRALKNFLYGIPENTLDDFLHEGKRLRVGGTLLGPGGEKLTVVRRKGRKGTLLGPDGTAVPEESLQTLLGGIDRETFVRLFSLTREELVSGGRALMEGKGGVGESLFTAGLGGVDLKGVLETLDQEASELFKPTGTNPRLNAEARTYKDLKARIRSLSLLPKEWEEVERSAFTQKTRSRQLMDQMADLSVREDHFKRLGQALPLMAELKELEQKRSELGAVRLLRKEFGLERQQAQLLRDRAVSEERTARKRIEEIDREMGALRIPENLLAQEKTIKGLVEELGSVEKARKDLPRVEGQVLEARQDAQGILKELRPDLDLDAAGELNLTVKEIAGIRRLAEEHGQASIRRQNTADKVRDWDRKLNQALKARAELPEPRKSTELERSVALIRKKGDLDKAYQEAGSEAFHCREEAEAALKGLTLWSGRLAEVESLSLPPDETVERFEKCFDTLEDDLRKRRDSLEETRSRMAEAETNLQRLKMAGEPPTEEELSATRNYRDQGWTLVKSAWLDGNRDEAAQKAFSSSDSLDQAYEKAVLKADDWADRMRREAEKIARRAALLAERSAQEERAGALSREGSKLEEDRKRLEEEWISRWASAGFHPLSPREMRGWTSRLKELARKAAEVRKREARVRDLTAEIEESKRVLSDGLAALNESTPSQGAFLEAYLLRTEEVIQASRDIETRRDGLSKVIEEAREGKGLAEEEAKRQETAGHQWQQEWNRVIQRLCPDLPVSSATLFLDRCQALKRRLEETEKDQFRIEGMKRDIQDFEKKVHDFVLLSAPEAKDGPGDQIVRSLSEKVTRGMTDHVLKRKLSAEKASKLKELATARETIRIKSDLLDALRREAGCREEVEFPEAERRSETACTLNDRVAELRKQILVLAAGQKVEVFAQEAAEEDPEKVALALNKVKADLAERQKELGQVQEALGASGERLRAMDGRPDAARTAQEAAEKLSSLRENTWRFLRLRLAARILRNEVEKYREKSQGPVLKSAEELFSLVTRGGFTGLEPDYGVGDEPVLVGVRQTGERVPLAGMSDGTQDQLYLALRLASLRHFLSGGTALPLLVDDALVNFDDQRARSAMKLFQKMGERIQVLFFTHHRHMVELAREALGDEALGFHEIEEHQ